MDAAAIETLLGKYRLVAEIARGGMGIVYLAVVHGRGGFSKLVVIKELRPELTDDPAFLSMFLEEARLAARLNHPNIVQTNEVDAHGRRHFLVMEYLEGQSLYRLRRSAPPPVLPRAVQLRILVDALAGLHYAHELQDIDGAPLGIVHRDISPQNIFVTFEGQTKLVDFGVAKALDTSVETRVGVLKGKIAYMAPEQAGGGRVDRRADIYAAGVILWECLVGRRLWRGMNSVAIMRDLFARRIPSALSANPAVPVELNRICERAMAVDREQRYPTADALRSDLERYMAVAGENATMRDVSNVVGNVFASDRAKIRALVEEQLMRVRRESSCPPTATTGLTSIGSLSGSTHSSANSDSVLPQSIPSGPTMGPTTSSAGPSMRTSMGAGRLERHWKPAASIVVVATLAVAVTLYKMGRTHDASQSPTPALAEGRPIPVAMTAAVSPPQVIEVAVSATPAAGRIAVDGVPAPINPFRASYPKEHTLHHVRVTADGYLPRVEDVFFDQNMSLFINLEREVNSARASPAPARHFGTLASRPEPSDAPASPR